MNKPVISENFTIDDIHKIRQYNYELTKNMTFEERRAYYDEGAASVLARIEELRAAKQN